MEKKLDMGHYDLEKLLEIKKIVNSILPGNDFIVDVDTHEGRTRIAINESGQWIKCPYLASWQSEEYRKEGYKIFVPDLVSFKLKTIIEYQEEPKPNKGYFKAKITKKGHDELSDADKDLYYELAGFKQIKIWESDDDETIKKILTNKLNNKDTT